jgi:two-component system nitrogen regulation response regulator NtrX
MGLAVRKFTSDAIATMEMYSWPGDVRQLRNAVEWSLIMAPPKAHVPIDSSMLPPELLESHQAIQRPETNADIMGMNLRCARELFEKQYLAAQLERFGWNISKTAAFVGMERSAFHRKLKSLDITQQNTLAEKEVS